MRWGPYMRYRDPICVVASEALTVFRLAWVVEDMAPSGALWLQKAVLLCTMVGNAPLALVRSFPPSLPLFLRMFCPLLSTFLLGLSCGCTPPGYRQPCGASAKDCYAPSAWVVPTTPDLDDPIRDLSPHLLLLLPRLFSLPSLSCCTVQMILSVRWSCAPPLGPSSPFLLLLGSDDPIQVVSLFFSSSPSLLVLLVLRVLIGSDVAFGAVPPFLWSMTQLFMALFVSTSFPFSAPRGVRPG